MNRFKDQNIRLSEFEDEIFVECPKCQLRAIVVKEEPITYFSRRILKCTNCFHSQVGRDVSYKIELDCHCSYCASEIKINLKNVNEKKEKIAIRCSNCGNTEDYKPRNIPIQWRYNNIGKPTKQYFGLLFG